MHLAAHTEPFYRGFAELARNEAGEDVYRYCSGCHSPAGVVANLIPSKKEHELPAEAKSGITCDVCHQIARLTGKEGPWGEPGNASVMLNPGAKKYTSTGLFEPNRAHTGEKRDFFSQSEFCASCHTVIHPINGLRIETTYEEWKGSPYAKKGIQCQDCHMRSPKDVAKVAESLRPVAVKGPRIVDGPTRDIAQHFFVGGNANAERLGGDGAHGKMAEAMLKFAARLELKAPAEYLPGKKLSLNVTVHNIAAGHNLPTGATELRQMWVELKIFDEKGKTLFQSGQPDAVGELPSDCIWFGASVVKRDGKHTIKLWEMERLTQKRTVPPKGSLTTPLKAELPKDLSGTIKIKARLLYRSASPRTVALAMKEKAFAPKIVEMAETEATVTRAKSKRD